MDSTRSRRGELAWGAGLFALALALRLAHLVTLAGSPFRDRLWLDLAFFDEWGARIAAGEWLGTGAFYQDPLYPYFLGVVYAIAGHLPTVAIVVQMVLGSLVPVIVYAATRRGMGGAEAAVAGLLAALYLPSIFYEALLLKSWMDLLLVATAVASLARAIERGSRWAWAGSGLLFGAACLARGNVILVLPALAAWILVDASASPRAPGWMPRARVAALFLAGAAIVLAASAARNRRVSGEWILTTTQAGQNFYLGNNPANVEGECDPPPFLRTNPKYEEADFAREALRRTGLAMTPAERSRFWFGEGLAWIRAHPADWLRLTWRKLRNFWGAYEIPDNIDLYVYREWAPLLRLPLPGFGTVAPLALLGVALGLRRGGWPRALLVFLGVYAAAVVLFFVLSRYRLAAMPALFAFAALAVVELGRRVREALGERARIARLLLPAGLGVLCFAVVNVPVRRPAGDPLFRLAAAIGLPTRAASVANEHFNLGVVYAREGDLVRAEAELRRALAEEPGRATIEVELGKVLARAGRTSEAIAAFERAAELEPWQPLIFHTLGILHRRAGDLDAAESAFSEALRLDPGRAETRRELDDLARRSAVTSAPAGTPR